MCMTVEDMMTTTVCVTDLLLDNLICVGNYESLPKLRFLIIKTLQTNETFYQQKNYIFFSHAY